MDGISRWWRKRRLAYNISLIIAGILAFLVSAVVGEILIMPYDDEYEITLFSIIFQGMGYLMMMVIANFCYYIGPITDRQINKKRDEKISKKLFTFGLIFSVLLPFLIPIMMVYVYLTQYAN